MILRNCNLISRSVASLCTACTACTVCVGISAARLVAKHPSPMAPAADVATVRKVSTVVVSATTTASDRPRRRAAAKRKAEPEEEDDGSVDEAVEAPITKKRGTGKTTKEEVKTERAETEEAPAPKKRRTAKKATKVEDVAPLAERTVVSTLKREVFIGAHVSASGGES